MLSKSMLVLSTALILGSASGAFATEDPENRIDHKYPWLEPIVRSNLPTDARGAFASGVRQTRPFTAYEKAWFDHTTRNVSAY